MSREKCPTCEQLIPLLEKYTEQLYAATEALVAEDHGIEKRLIELLSSESPDFAAAAQLTLAYEAVVSRKIKAEMLSSFFGMLGGAMRVDKPTRPKVEHGHSLEDLIQGMKGPLEP